MFHEKIAPQIPSERLFVSCDPGTSELPQAEGGVVTQLLGYRDGIGDSLPGARFEFTVQRPSGRGGMYVTGTPRGPEVFRESDLSSPGGVAMRIVVGQHELTRRISLTQVALARIDILETAYLQMVAEMRWRMKGKRS